jgi:anti-sigma factor (TIGR02949 family)
MTKTVCFVDEAELNLFLDNELPSSRQSALGEHLGHCSNCSTKYDIVRGLKDIVRKVSRDNKAPLALRVQILSRIESAPPKPASSFWEAAKNIFIFRPLLPIGIAVGLVAAFFSVVLLRPSSSGAMKLVNEMVHEHNEYIAGFESDNGIQSADPQEVVQWIAVNSDMKINLARCDKSPSLVGACEIEEDGRNITCLFFDRGEKRISLFMLHSGAGAMPEAKTMKVKDKSVYFGSCTGNNYILWSDGGVVSILVSRLPENSLIDMAENLI